MAKVFGWKDIPTDNPKKDGGKRPSRFLRLEPGNEYTIRLVLDPIGYMQHWEPFRCRSPYKDEKTGEIIDPLMALGHEPKPRFACWVFDRNDSNALKLMDFSISLAKDFKKWSSTNGGESAGGMKGPNFRVIVEKGATRLQTRYTAVHMDVAPFTQEEIAVLKAEGGTEGLMNKLREYRKDDTPEEIRQMMAQRGISGPPQPPAQVAQASAQPAAPAAPAAPATPEATAAPATPAAPAAEVSGDEITF